MAEWKLGRKTLSPQCNVTEKISGPARLLRRLLLFLLVCHLPANSHAENLLDVFQQAIESDSQLKAAQSARQAMLTHKPQATADFFPRLSAEGSTGKVVQNLKDAAGAETISPTTGKVISSILGQNIYNQISLTLKLKQPLYNVEIFRSRKLAEIDSVKAELNYRIAQQDLIFRVAKAYFNVLAGTDELNFARAEKNAIARQLEQTKQRFNAGLTAVTNVHEAQARHDMAVAQEIMAETELAKRQEALRRITGKTYDNLMQLKPDMPLTPPTPGNMDDWTEAARAQNFQIAALKYDADKIKQQMEVTRGKHYPTLDLSASYGYNKWGGPYRQESTDAMVSLDFYVSLFEGNKISQQLREQRHRFDEAIHKIDVKEREIMQEVRQAFLSVIAGMSYVKAISQAMQSSENALRATQAGFDVGTRTAVEVLDAQRELFRSQRDFARARYDYLLNTLRLKLSVGLLTIDDLEQINNWLE